MKRWHATSLTLRLACMFALVAIVTFAGVGLFLYQSLASQLEARDDSELVNKVALIRHLLAETPSVASIHKDPHRFLDAIAEHDELIFIMKSADEVTLTENRPMRNARPLVPLVAVGRIPTSDSMHVWTLPSGLLARTVAAWGALGGTREVVQIVLARTASHRMAVLETYQRQILIGVLSGAILAALAGYSLTRRALRPVREIARQAQTITAQRLDTRLDATKAPTELQTLIAAFNAMLDRLHESFQRLSQFSGDLAHDMRTPLNNLMVQTQVALAHPRTVDEYHLLMGSNIEEYERLARMVDSMLFLARADYAPVAIEKARLDPAVELHRIADYFEGVADDAGVSIAVASQGNLVADAILMRRAVNNLVANAIRYAVVGSTIQLTSYPDGHHMVISVANTGPAIDPHDLPWLFDRFYRADAARSGSASSTGLGLAIVQSIMKMHGGRAEVESTTQQTVFRLLFPSAALAQDVG